MRQRILKWELGFLFFIALVSLGITYFGENLPDNSFEISSSSNDVSFFSYYILSFFRWIEFYSGPWLLFSFIFFSGFFAWVYQKRGHKLDTLFLLSLLIFNLTLTYFAFPSLIGGGLFDTVLKTLPLSIIIALSCITGFFTLWLGFRKSFIEIIKLCSDKFISVMKYLLSFSYIFKMIDNLKKVKTKFQKSAEKEISQKLITPLPEKVEQPSFLPKRESEEPQSRKPILKREKTREPVSKTFKTTTGEKDQVEKFSALESENLIASLIGTKTRKGKEHPDQAYFQDITKRIEDKLAEFKITAKIINIMKGPVVDTYELQLGEGIKVSKVNSITEDLSLALFGAPIRIVYPLTGKTTMGIEVPRDPRELIYLDEVLESKEYLQAQRQLPICMGKDAYGEAFIVDLAKMPHMLIAGATGAGKSVFINTLLVSLLVKKSPSEMKMILIDPKQLELALYSETPHLALPVITDGKRASLALKWACQEMERRYSILKEVGVRNIEGYNAKIKNCSKEKREEITKFFSEEDGNNLFLPYLVIVIDEFADLILTKAGKEIENNVCRLAAKARASGIHLVLATQRPSVDVITGLIKSNFPTRVSFRVTTSVDSRTILGCMGSEKLLGMGDMLYKQGIEIRRLHAAFVDEDEIECLMEKLKEIPSSYNPVALNFMERREEDEQDEGFLYTPNGNFEDGGEDDKYREAVQCVSQYRKASASFLQRRLGVGYNRAANLIERMESEGLVGPQLGSKPREILMGSLSE